VGVSPFQARSSSDARLLVPFSQSPVRDFGFLMVSLFFLLARPISIAS